MRNVHVCETISFMQHAIGQIQNDTLRVLSRNIPAGPAALLDFPSHQNAGDSLIYAGEIAYLDRIASNIRYICDIERYDPVALRNRVPEGPILLHGGGNFGDRWPRYQVFRERVIKEFPDRPVIALPQSMEFRSSSALEAARNSLARHANLTLLLREHRSFSEAVATFGQSNNVEYCPDLAFGAGFQAVAKTEHSVDVVQILRRDSERIEREMIALPCSTAEFDWGLTGLDAALWRLARIPGRVALTTPAISRRIYPVLAGSYRAQAQLNLRRARLTLQTGRILLTDRLHAAVLGALIGMRVVALDNSYGKISAVYRDYLHKFDNVEFADSGYSARAAVERLL